MGIILEADGLRKSYFTKPVLNGISLAIEEGSILGLLGPNGSGKTTFLKIIAGLLHATSGDVRVCGQSIGLETKRLVSFLPDRNCLYPRMTALDVIQFYQDFFDDFDRNKALDLLEFMELEQKQTIKTMSKGMIEKMNLTLTFSRAAKLFVLDEPLGERIRSLVKGLSKRSLKHGRKTVRLSSVPISLRILSMCLQMSLFYAMVQLPCKAMRSS